MAIVQNFSPTDFTTKTQTLTVTAGQTFRLGSPYSGGTATDVFTNADLIVKQSGVVKTNGIDFTPTDVDKRLSAEYGYTYYTAIKSINITGEIEVTYRCHGSFVDAEIINQHEDRLNSYDAAIAEYSSHLVAIDNTDTAQNNRLSAVESAVLEETENRTAADTWLQSVIDLETEYRTEADTALQTNIDAEASARTTGDETNATNLSNHIADTTAAHGATSAATASTIVARDADGRAQVANPLADADIANKSYVDSRVVAVGAGDVTSASTSSTHGNFAIMSGTTGKVIAASEYSPSSFTASNAVRSESIQTTELYYSNQMAPNTVYWWPDYTHDQWEILAAYAVCIASQYNVPVGYHMLILSGAGDQDKYMPHFGFQRDNLSSPDVSSSRKLFYNTTDCFSGGHGFTAQLGTINADVPYNFTNWRLKIILIKKVI